MSGPGAWRRAAAALLGGALMLAPGAAARAQGVQAAADAFRYSLSPLEASDAVKFFAEPGRMEWRRPKGGAGLSWPEMDVETRAAAEALIRAALSESGWRAFETAQGRGGGPLALTLFGEPNDASAPWGFRCIARDISLNFTYRGARLISATPLSYVVPSAQEADAFVASVQALPDAPRAQRERALLFVLSPTPEPFRKSMARSLAERGALSSGYETGSVMLMQGGGAQLALERIEQGALLLTLEDEQGNFGATQ